VKKRLANVIMERMLKKEKQGMKRRMILTVRHIALGVGVSVSCLLSSTVVLNAYEHRTDLITGIWLSPTLRTAQPMDWMEMTLGISLATGGSSDSRLEPSMGIFADLGLVSDWVSTRCGYSTEGLGGELTAHLLKSKRFDVAAGIGGQYAGETVYPFCAVYCSRSLGTSVPYVNLKYGRLDCEMSCPDYG
jgi:hypothetical protein